MNEVFVEAKLASGEKLLVNSERILYYVFPDEGKGSHDETATGTIVFDNGERLGVLNGYHPRASLSYLRRPQLPPPQFVDRRAPQSPRRFPRQRAQILKPSASAD